MWKYRTFLRKINKKWIKNLKISLKICFLYWIQEALKGLRIKNSRIIWKKMAFWDNYRKNQKKLFQVYYNQEKHELEGCIYTYNVNLI